MQRGAENIIVCASVEKLHFMAVTPIFPMFSFTFFPVVWGKKWRRPIRGKMKSAIDWSLIPPLFASFPKCTVIRA